MCAWGRYGAGRGAALKGWDIGKSWVRERVGRAETIESGSSL